jgi:hypothetical protein
MLRTQILCTENLYDRKVGFVRSDHKILININNKSKAKGIFCDIEKAFDCVNHNILLHKLEIYVLGEI